MRTRTASVRASRGLFCFLRAQEQMSHYGFLIIKTLVTDLSPAAQVNECHYQALAKQARDLYGLL